MSKVKRAKLSKSHFLMLEYKTNIIEIVNTVIQQIGETNSSHP